MKMCTNINCPSRRSGCCNAKPEKLHGAPSILAYICSRCGLSFTPNDCTCAAELTAKGKKIIRGFERSVGITAPKSVDVSIIWLEHLYKLSEEARKDQEKCQPP